MSGGNGVSTSSSDNTNGDSSGGNSSALAYVGIVIFVGIALFITLYCIRNRIRNQDELPPSPLASPGVAREADINRRSRHHGLDLEDISLLPTFPYESTKRSCRNKLHEHKVSSAECAVCLGELEEGEMVRLLPACKHYFHVKCIDMWLCTRSSCPMCRAHPEPEKVKFGMLSVSPPWHNLMHSSSERRQFSFGSCLGSPFVKTPSNKSQSSIGTSPLFHGSWQGSPNILITTPPRELQSIPVEEHTQEISEIREIS